MLITLSHIKLLLYGTVLYSMMPRPKVGLKKQKTGSTERKGSKSKKDPQQETFKHWQRGLHTLTFPEIDMSNDEYATSEPIDTYIWSTPISALVTQKFKQKI